jgi:hypothetical protein
MISEPGTDSVADGAATGTARMRTVRPLVSSDITITAVPQFAPADPRSHLVAAGPAGNPGRYRITFVLAVPGRQVAQEAIDFHAAIERGDSLLAVGDDTTSVAVDLVSDDGTETGIHMLVGINNQHRLRDVSVEINADGFQQAAQVSYDLIMPVISRWSFLADIAITTSAQMVEELATGVISFEAPLVGVVKEMPPIDGTTDPDHRLLLGSYREGLSSAEPLWRALSFYKVAEGVRYLRDGRRKERQRAGQPPIKLPSERIPAVPEELRDGSLDGDSLATSMAPYAGKKFSKVLDDVRGDLRNTIAHLEPGKNPLAHDQWQDVTRIRQAIPTLRWIARRLLFAELALDSETNDTSRVETSRTVDELPRDHAA